MTDNISRERRSENMRRIRSKDMKPEILVRRITHALGYRFRIHRNDLPGRPDLVLPRHHKIIFVHGCFWHGHDDPKCIDGRRIPKSNLDYWIPKLARNRERDREVLEALNDMGWSTMVVWECETRKLAELSLCLRSFIANSNNDRRAA